MVLTSIVGIGEETAKILAEHDIDSIKKLTETSLKGLMKVPGFGVIRAKRVLAAATGSQSATTDEKESTKKRSKKQAKALKQKNSPKKSSKKSSSKKKVKAEKKKKSDKKNSKKNTSKKKTKKKSKK